MSEAREQGPARLAAWGLGVVGVSKLAGALLSSTSMAGMVAQAVIAEWGLGRIGVTWSDPLEEVPETKAIARRALGGAAIGLLAAGALLGLAAATRAALFAKADAPGAVLGIGLLSAGFVAMRDELLLRGLVLRVTEDLPARGLRLVACALTAGCAATAEPGATPASVAATALLGVVFGALWIRDRGAWLAWGAHTAFTFAVGTLAQGGLVEARVARSAWGGGDAGLLGGFVAVAALAPLAIAAFAWAGRPTSRS